MRVPLEKLIGHLEVEGIELDDGEIIADAFVVIRTVRPDRDHPITAYTGTDGVQDTATKIGLLTLVLDKVRADARSNWSDED